MTPFKTNIDAIKQLSTAGAVSIHVPTLGRAVKFKQITTKQQKDIVKTAIDKIAPGLSFYNAVNTVVRENNIENAVINTVDRLFIISALRAACLASEVKTKNSTVNLSQLVATPYNINPDSLTKTITVGNVTIKCTSPSLEYDTDMTAECIRKIGEESTVVALGETFISEIVKFIETIGIDGNVITMSEYTPNQRFQLVESLPAGINNEILTFINTIKELESAFVIVDGKRESLDIDQAFFTV